MRLTHRYRQWKADRKRYPTRWLSYRRRLKTDVELAYKLEGGEVFFDEQYIDKLTADARALDAWIVKLAISQFLIGLYLLDWIISGSVEGTIFGISIKYKEVIIALLAVLGLISYILTGSRDLRIWIIETLVSLRTRNEFSDFAQLAAYSGFHIKTYSTKPYARWIFPKFSSKLSFALLTFLGLFLLLALLAVSYGLFIYVLVDAYKNPGLPPPWSSVVVWFAVLTHIFGLLWLVRLWIPLPYKDMGILLELKNLEQRNPERYRQRLSEIFHDP